MGKKLVTAQGAFTMLVPGLTAPTDPSRASGQVLSKAAVDNGTPLATAPSDAAMGKGYRSQNFLDVPGKGQLTQPTSGKTPGTSTRTGLIAYETGTTPLPGRVDIECVAATVPDDFIPLGPTFIHLGDHVIEVGVDFDLGATAAACADNLAAFIDSFPDWSSAATGSGTIRANGPEGIVGNEVIVYVSGPGASLWSLETIGGADTQGRLHDADPHIGPPVYENTMP